MNTRKIAFVVPRYGVQSAGGAEMLAQGVAERLAASGNEVSVLTTCACDHFTWANHYRPGRETIRDVTVHRFPVDPRDAADDFASIQERISRGTAVAPEEEERWIRGSVHSAPLYDFIRENRDRFGCFIFLPYLFGTTWAGSAVAPEKSLLIPCLHDEPYARLGIFRGMFARVRGILFNSRPERELAARLFGTEDASAAVAGMGFEARPRYRPERFRRKFGLKTHFLLYAGRREQGKNTPLLIEYVRTFRKGNPAHPLSLVLLGTGEVRIPPECAGDILDIGYIDEDLKHDGYAASLALCQPSVNESLSIVLMEAWLAGAPGLVNGRCAVTSDHCTRANGGLAFRDYYEFEESLLYLLGHAGLRERLAAGGRRYVEREYSWNAVMKRYDAAFALFDI
ncbi:MAG: glycosyltransferase family 4 protein [Chlamydiota bacterium]